MRNEQAYFYHRKSKLRSLGDWILDPDPKNQQLAKAAETFSLAGFRLYQFVQKTIHKKGLRLMADALFLGFIIYLVCLFIYKSYKNHKDGYVSTRDINKYYSESVGLKNKHRSKVPHYDKNGGINTDVKQFLNKEGVYSREYREEHKELRKKCFGK